MPFVLVCYLRGAGIKGVYISVSERRLKQLPQVRSVADVRFGTFVYFAVRWPCN